MGTKSTVRIVLSIVIIVAYFLPWFQLVISESAFDIITRSGGDADRTGQMIWYASLLIPVMALLCLIQTLSKKTPGGFVRSIPFIITAIFVLLLYVGINKDNNVDAKGFFSIFGIGMYLTLVASFLLIFMGRDTVVTTTTANTTVNPM